MKTKLFQIEHQFELHLKGMDLDPSKMSEVEKTQIKLAFMGGMTKMLQLLTIELPKESGEKIISSLYEQLVAFWEDQQ